MSGHEALDAECRRLTRYLIAEEPTPYVTACYRRAHEVSPAFLPASRFERVALRVGAVLPRLADAHARLFAPASVLRRKLVLLLAILESSPSYRRVDDPGPRGPLLAWARLAWIGLTAVVAALLGSLLLLPVQLLLGGR